MFKRAFALVLSAVLLAVPAAGFSYGAADIYDPIGDVFTNVRAPYMLEGGLPSSTDYFTDADFAENRITILNLWDSACLFCRVELPYFEQVSNEYADSGVRVVGMVGTRMGGTYPAAYEFLQQYCITYTNVIPDEGLQAIAFMNANTPQTFIVDSEGTVVDYICGATTYEELAEKLGTLLTMRGDVDCSGELSFADVTGLYGYVVGSNPLTTQGRINADVDGNGTVSFNDVSVLYQTVLG